MGRWLVDAAFACCCCWVAGCGGGGGVDVTPPIPNRSFAMGFTPWPPAASSAALDGVYDQIQTDGDIVAHHFMEGVPWQEAFAGDPYPAAVANEIALRLARTRAESEVYLAIDSLDGARSGLVDNWGASGGEPRSGVWATRSFADAEVIDAYSSFAEDLIASFGPTYFCYGVEVGDLMVEDAAAFDDFVVFAAAVTARLRTSFPGVQLMVSLPFKTPGSAPMQTMTTGFARIADFVDVVGISTYPYAFYSHPNKGDPDNLPADWLTQIGTVAPGKPVAITETGWPAEEVRIPTFGLDVDIAPFDQQNFVLRLLAGADALDARFVIWFALADYDELWTNTLGSDPLAAIWRDIGLTGGDFAARLALSTWRIWFARPR